ncbi:hypothetical protein PMZ80_009879 [Knufia obscura]|uniref:Uncharacterized protein n=2 Tax=Knufia TaxID=430999 RepID=A0AAN8IQF3_9EURO|nr:hypothetical protein PMZ80_009879 [Knufia obscura]KAK5955972.1 hypothetical protein OHC33_002545 [Knufia fluminis]
MADVQYLTEKEIDDFVAQLDKDNDGCISYTELEQKLDQVYKELQPEAKAHNLHHSSRTDTQRHEFLRSMLGTNKDKIPDEEFKKIVKTWQVPSMEQEKQSEKKEQDYLNNITWARRLRAIWEVQGPEYCFVAFVVSAQIALGVWQCIKYATGPQYQAAFGWGVAFAKFSAGALYPTLFFLLLSMSRWFHTFMRRFYYVSRFINTDKSQSFHIYISIAAICLATLHAIGHLSGTFNFGSRPGRQDAVAALLGPDAVPRPYSAYIQALPGWTGLTALGTLYVIGLLSMPYIRTKFYEIFQLGHLLMYLFIAMIMAHGGLALLQFPIMGILLAFPTLLIILERTVRTLSAFQKIPAKLEVLDEETVVITCTIPKRRIWNYEAGQYVFLCVQQISHFQWHPFTISTCIGREMQLHIKTDGDWVSQLRNLKDLKYVAIDGPYGAPAQRFYDFDQTIIVGAGIGVTPFSGILTDLQTREDNNWTQRRYSTSSNESNDDRESEITRVTQSRHPSTTEKTTTTVPTIPNTTTTTTPQTTSQTPGSQPTHTPKPTNTATDPEKQTESDLTLYRRTDFHWIVRDKNHLLWFSGLLNSLSGTNHSPNLDIRIHPHLTKKFRNPPISLHIYRSLLEKHRTPSQPISPLTGLITPTHFGRPDFPRILDEHYGEMLSLFAKDRSRRRRVGVFFCGAPVIGEQLADLCSQMTIRGREDGSGVEYFFMIEVFG